MLHREGADAALVGPRALAAGRVHDQRDFTVLDMVDQVRMTLGDFLHAPDRDAFLFQTPRRARRGHQLVAQRDQSAGQVGHERFVPRRDAHENLALARFGQHDAGRQLSLGERDRKSFADPHHFARAPHFGSEHNIDADEFAEREYALLDRDVGRDRLADQSQLRQRHAGHDLGRQISHRQPGRLGDKGHRPAGSRIHLQHVDDQFAVFLLDGELDVHQANHTQLHGKRLGRFADLLDDRSGKTVRRDRAGRVARMHARLLDVFHHARHDHVLAVGNCIDVDFGGVFQKTIDQHRLTLGHDERFGNVPFELRLVVANLHRSPAQHETGSDQCGEAHFDRFASGLLHGAGDRVGRLFQTQLFQQLFELLAILRRFDRIDRCADDRNAGRREGSRQIERRLAAELHDHTVRLDAVADIQHVFGRQRLEEQQVARVVVRTDRFGVRVDHDRLDPHFAQGETGMAATIVELDPLTDAIRTAS